MGCTSSAPTVATPEANTTTEPNVTFVQNMYEKDIKQNSEIITETPNKSDDTNVLPKCDVLVESLQVVRNNKSLDSDLGSIENVKENQEKESATEKNNGHKLMDTSQEDKLSSLEEVVERVIETKVGDDVKCDSPNSQDGKIENDGIKDDNGNKNNTEETTITPETEDGVNANEDEPLKEENTEETVSPSQSEASRVTRWEALADIAAELPPSLAIDPITGQIYALSK